MRLTEPRAGGEVVARALELGVTLRLREAHAEHPGRRRPVGVGRAGSGRAGLGHSRAAVWGVPTCPILGTTRVDRLEQNAAAAGIALDRRDLALLDGASARL